MKAFLFLTLAVSAMAVAKPTETFVIENKCDDTLYCIELTGTFSRATAKVNGKAYTETSKDATCCQLASGIQQQVCDDGNSSENVLVNCM